ncbi:MAG TPA: tRNA lysidine(34) synthetase TilS [Devosia sp.]|nr:tRNA lysidine(34) synthetase TilS [Devosia sp.]
MSGLSRRPGLDPKALFAPLDDFHCLALAVSGGPDSLALLLLAAEYARATGTQERFVVYSVDHGLRPEAAAEVAFVLREAERLGIFARGLRWEGEKPATGISEAARHARYRLMAEAMQADGATALVTAHHLGDQAETVLMRLAHGSGIEGLRGMDMFSQVGDLTIIRPLLAVDPADLAAVVSRAGITPVTDPSNADLDYERVRWRQMLPQLATLGLDARRLGRFAERMGEAETALVSMTAEAMSLVTIAPGVEEASIDRQVLRAIPFAVAVRVVAKMLDLVGRGQKPHGLGAVEALTARLVREPVRSTLHGCLVRTSRGTIRVLREPGREAARKRRARQAPA